MKRYRIRVRREYTTDIFMVLPNDGKNHKEDLDDRLRGGDSDLWYDIAQKELEQMDIDHEDYEITEVLMPKSYKKQI